MTDLRQNLLVKQEESSSLTEYSWFYLLKKSGSTYFDKKINAINLYKFIINLFISSESESDYSGNEILLGKDNSTFVKLSLSKINSFGFYEMTFGNEDLIDYKLIVNHLLNTRKIYIEWYDSNWEKQSLDGILKLSTIDEFEINFGGEILDGTHTLYYKIY